MDVFKGRELTFAVREDGSEVKVYWKVTGLSTVKFELFLKSLRLNAFTWRENSMTLTNDIS